VREEIGEQGGLTSGSTRSAGQGGRRAWLRSWAGGAGACVIGPEVRHSASWAGSSGLGRRSCSREELGRRAYVLAGWQAGLHVGQAGWLAGLCGFVSWAGLRV